MEIRSTLEATSALYRSLPGVGFFRVGLGLAQRWWPSLAVRAASRLFLTPLPPKWLQRGAVAGEGWRIEAWPFERVTLAVHALWGPVDAPVVLLVHGWGGHAAQMRPLAEALRAAGLRPVIVEMPGHGHSGGMRSTLPQFARAIDYVHHRLQQQGHVVQALVAHSLGATAAAYAASRGLGVARLVLLAPAASPPAFTSLFAQVFGLSERTRAAMQARIEAREAMLMPLFEAPAVGPRIVAATLVVHDRQDTMNQFGDGQAFVDAVPGAQLLATDGLGHRRILKDERVLAAVAQFAGEKMNSC
ncbi:MAG: alpha/beta fold hydrolase [Pseudomonadota bacterium]